MAMLDFGPADRAVDIVFSHANGFNGRTYRSILAPLAEDLRILALDMRGHGSSTLPVVVEGRVGGWLEYRDDLLALLALETGPGVVLAGHSMGGSASLLAAAAAPDRVKGLALFDPVFFDPARAPPAGAPNLLAEGAERRRAVFESKAAAIATYTGRGAFRSWSAEQLADYVEAGFVSTRDGQITLACTSAWEASNFRTHTVDAWTALQACRCPVRLLRAEVGSTARIDDRLPDIAAMPNIRIETVPGTSHFLPMERPDRVQAVLREAVAEARTI